MSYFTIKITAYAAIESKYQCAHEQRELRLRTIADERKAYYCQCIRCGQAGRAIPQKLAKFELKGQAAPPFDDELEFEWHARKSTEYHITYQEIEPSLRAEYEAYLESEEWKQKRAVILLRASNVCECCKHYPATEIHHKTYAHIGQELAEDLMAVCNLCHKLLHGRVAL